MSIALHDMAEPARESTYVPSAGDLSLIEFEAEAESLFARIDRELAIEEALTRAMMARHGL